MKKISWFTPSNLDESGDLWYSQGYFNAALNTIKALQEKDVAVYYNRSNIPFHINFCLPVYYQLNRSYTVGYTPWESTKVPLAWKDPVSKCNELWATSQFTKNVFVNNNLHHNIKVIPHGISPEFEIYDRELNNRFNFLHIGGDAKRKNVQMVIDSFLEVHEGNSDIHLYLKYNKYCDGDVYLDGKILPADKHPQITSIPDVYDLEEMVSLYKKCHCLVYPTSGEGFGMIPFEAICTGMPTIVTNLTGTADFAHMSIPLEAEWGEAPFQSHMYGFDAGNWAIPNYDALCGLMENVVDEYEMFKKHTLQSARILHEKQSWSAVADMIVERIQDFEMNL